MYSVKCPSLMWSTPPPAQCTMNASKMMAKIAMTTQMKNTIMLGTACPATVLALATAPSYPPPPDLFTSAPGSAAHIPTGASRHPRALVIMALAQVIARLVTMRLRAMQVPQT
jgi:hypothetical protein